MTEESLRNECHKIIMAGMGSTREGAIKFVIATELLKRLEAEEKQRRINEVNERLQRKER